MARPLSVLVLTIILLCLLLCPALAERFFTGNVEIQIIEPTDTVLAVCTPSEKYTMEPGQNTTIRLYVRNAMIDKTVGRVYLEVISDPGLSFHPFPAYLENLPPDEYQWFDINVSADRSIGGGNHHVEFLVGTDEYMIGSHTDSIIIRIVPHARLFPYIMAGIIACISVALVVRFIHFRKLNRRAQRAHAKRTHKPIVSESYYKRS